MDSPETGAVTLIQRFGGSVNLNIHFHQLWMEGVFFKNSDADPAKFGFVPKTTNDEVVDVLSTIRKRVVRLLIKRGYLEKDESLTGTGAEGFENSEALLSGLLSASTQNKIALGERQGQAVRKVGSFGGPNEKPRLGPLCATLGGFSLHANVFIPEDKPEKLEKLCRYVSRPPVAESRLFKQENGEVGYFLKSQWSDGTFAVSFSALEFIEKLVALIPQPRIHLTRFHGVLAPNHAWRKSVVPEPKKKKEDGSKCHHGRMKWAELLKRVFQIDLKKCPDCAGEVKFVSAIMKRDVVVKILDHLKLPSELPRWSPPRAPPNMSFEF
ncbi:MAG: transposase [Ignavibacteriales bacterium]|nr:transposase [Ignavibacteriales bacterium]